jgi:hypothetical protein
MALLVCRRSPRASRGHRHSIHGRDKELTMKKVTLNVEELEARIAPDGIGNPGNNNPPENNTNNPGNEGTGGKVSTGN